MIKNKELLGIIETKKREKAAKIVGTAIYKHSIGGSGIAIR